MSYNIHYFHEGHTDIQQAIDDNVLTITYVYRCWILAFKPTLFPEVTSFGTEMTQLCKYEYTEMSAITE